MNCSEYLEENANGCLLHVKAFAGARNNQIRGVENGRLKIAVTQVPEKGKANKAIATLIAKTLGIAKGRVQLVAGETNSMKSFLVTDLSAADLVRVLPPTS
ncbi:MAG: DUF167 family protein [Pirellulaceae bacterium]